MKFYTLTAGILVTMSIRAQAPAGSAPSIVKADSVTAEQEKINSRRGVLWGLVYADLFYKAHADSAKRGTGGNLPYAGGSKDSSGYDFRRIFLGYDYTISEHFSTELLLAYETPVDVLNSGNRALYLKAANLRWKNIFPHSDLVAGAINTPTFSYLAARIWNRVVERTLTDLQKLGSSTDAGLLLQGSFDSNANYGYNLMAGNGNSNKPENNVFKKIYGDVYFKFFDKKLVVDFYADYERQKLLPGYHVENSTFKFFTAYQSVRFTAGIEAVEQVQSQSVVYFEPQASNPSFPGSRKDTVSSAPFGLSAFVLAPIKKNYLGWFARYDWYDPDRRFSSANFYTSGYKGNIKQAFVTVGLDYTPYKEKNVHIIPNIWYYRYQSLNDGYHKIEDSSALKKDFDLVYRITISYTFNK